MSKLTLMATGAIAFLGVGTLLGSGWNVMPARVAPAPTIAPSPIPSPLPSPTFSSQSTEAQPVSPPATPQPNGMVLTPGHDGLNLRSAPSLEPESIIGFVKTGSPVTVLQRQGEFYAVITPDGESGWVHQKGLIRRMQTL